MRLFDCHTHIQFAAFEHDYKEVIERALKDSIGVVNVGTQKDTSRRAIEVAHEFPENVYATVGLHPIHTEKSYHDVQELGGAPDAKGFTSRGEEFDYEYYKKLAQDKKVVAIGECGLDYYRIGTRNQEIGTRVSQKEVFIKHIELAKELNKPLMIHCRSSKGTDDAYEDLLSLVPSHLSLVPNKIVHFYAGGVEITKKFLEAGFYFTLGGVITFARDYDEQIKMIPLERILLETDAPYVAPEPYRGKRNEPVYIIETAKKMAEIKGLSFENVCAVTSENAKRVFKI